MLDSERDICLNCSKPKCTNCLAKISGLQNKYVPILQIDQKTRQVVAIHENIKEAARASGGSYTSVQRAVKNHIPFRGYLWKKSR